MFAMPLPVSSRSVPAYRCSTAFRPPPFRPPRRRPGGRDPVPRAFACGRGRVFAPARFARLIARARPGAGRAPPAALPLRHARTRSGHLPPPLPPGGRMDARNESGHDDRGAGMTEEASPAICHGMSCFVMVGMRGGRRLQPVRAWGADRSSGWLAVFGMALSSCCRSVPSLRSPPPGWFSATRLVFWGRVPSAGVVRRAPGGREAVRADSASFGPILSRIFPARTRKGETLQKFHEHLSQPFAAPHPALSQAGEEYSYQRAQLRPHRKMASSYRRPGPRSGAHLRPFRPAGAAQREPAVCASTFRDGPRIGVRGDPRFREGRLWGRPRNRFRSTTAGITAGLHPFFACSFFPPSPAREGRGGRPPLRATGVSRRAWVGSGGFPGLWQEALQPPAAGRCCTHATGPGNRHPADCEARRGTGRMALPSNPGRLYRKEFGMRKALPNAGRTMGIMGNCCV